MSTKIFKGPMTFPVVHDLLDKNKEYGFLKIYFLLTRTIYIHYKTVHGILIFY